MQYRILKPLADSRLDYLTDGKRLASIEAWPPRMRENFLNQFAYRPEFAFIEALALKNRPHLRIKQVEPEPESAPLPTEAFVLVGWPVSGLVNAPLAELQASARFTGYRSARPGRVVQKARVA
jgi:hypothetical protein